MKVWVVYVVTLVVQITSLLVMRRVCCAPFLLAHQQESVCGTPYQLQKCAQHTITVAQQWCATLSVCSTHFSFYSMGLGELEI